MVAYCLRHLSTVSILATLSDVQIKLDVVLPVNARFHKGRLVVSRQTNLAQEIDLDLHG